MGGIGTGCCQASDLPHVDLRNISSFDVVPKPRPGRDPARQVAIKVLPEDFAGNPERYP